MPVVIEDLLEGILGGTTWGIGLLAAAAVATVGAPHAKPLAKRAIRGYLVVTERARGALAEASESLQDLYVEAKHEYQSGLVDAASAENGTERPRRNRRGAEIVTPA